MISAENLLEITKSKGKRVQMSEKNVPVLALDIEDIEEILLSNAGKSKGFSFINGGILSDDVIGELRVAGYNIYLSKNGDKYSSCIEWKKNSAKKYLAYGEYTEL